MTDREEFYRQVKNAIGKRPKFKQKPLGIPAESNFPEGATLEKQEISDPSDIVTDELFSSCIKAGWNLHRAKDREGVIRHVLDIVASSETNKVVLSEDWLLNELGVSESLNDTGFNTIKVSGTKNETRESMRDTIIQADIGITGADYVIAETGSCVISAGKGASRLVSLVPPVHIVIADKSAIIPGLNELFSLLHISSVSKPSNEMTSHISIISGPSRSADIEYTLIQGVHGPGEVHMIILEDHLTHP